jgi:hypothetical protein
MTNEQVDDLPSNHYGRIQPYRNYYEMKKNEVLEEYEATLRDLFVKLKIKGQATRIARTCPP